MARIAELLELTGSERVLDVGTGGGLLAIGNALGPNDHFWMCEFACDWTLIYRDRDDLRVVKLNVDENQQTAAQFGVLSIPTMILFKDGQAVQQIVGAQPRPRIESALDSVLVA